MLLQNYVGVLDYSELFLHQIAPKYTDTSHFIKSMWICMSVQYSC
jgi:hypothetical protein